MIAVYVLISERDHNRYIGSASDLGRRIAQHNRGLVRSTRNRRPLRLYAVQRCASTVEARLLEVAYKKSRGKFEKAIEDKDLKIIGA